MCIRILFFVSFAFARVTLNPRIFVDRRVFSFGAICVDGWSSRERCFSCSPPHFCGGLFAATDEHGGKEVVLVHPHVLVEASLR